MEYTLYWQLFFLWFTNSTIISAGQWWGAMSCNKTFASGVNLHKFPKEMKDSRLLPVSMLWSSVLSDRLLSLSSARQLTNSLNSLSKSNLQTIKPAASTCRTYSILLHAISNVWGVVCVFGCPYLSYNSTNSTNFFFQGILTNIYQIMKYENSNVVTLNASNAFSTFSQFKATL